MASVRRRIEREIERRMPTIERVAARRPSAPVAKPFAPSRVRNHFDGDIERLAVAHSSNPEADLALAMGILMPTLVRRRARQAPKVA